jgi:hypothetical protein
MANRREPDKQHGREDLAFAWLDQYCPVARAGKSILLGQIPEAVGIPITPSRFRVEVYLAFSSELETLNLLIGQLLRSAAS